MYGGGSRITDAVDFFKRRGELRGAVRTVRDRMPERFRWRAAVGTLTKEAGQLRGLDRMRVEEPVREVVVDGIGERRLKHEVILDARRNGVDLDRGEVLPARTVSDVRRVAWLTGSDMERVQRYVKVSDDFFAPVDTAAVVVVGRAWADYHRRRARQIWLQLPDPDGRVQYKLHHHLMAERARREAHLCERWGAFARALLEGR